MVPRQLFGTYLFFVFYWLRLQLFFTSPVDEGVQQALFSGILH